MPSDRVTVITSYFEDMRDPRVNRTQLHPLSGIILSTLIGMLAGADDWVHIEWCGQVDDLNGLCPPAPSSARSPAMRPPTPAESSARAASRRPLRYAAS